MWTDWKVPHRELRAGKRGLHLYQRGMKTSQQLCLVEVSASPSMRGSLENLVPFDEIGNPTAPSKVHPWQGEKVGVQMEQPWWARGPSWDRISLGTGWVISGKILSISEPVFPSEK